MGKLFLLLIISAAAWVGFCEGRYYEQLEQVKPTVAPVKMKPSTDNELTLGELIEKANREADKRQAKLAATSTVNNAGNLRNSDGSFQTFKTPKAGYNALVKDIKIKLSGNSRMMKAKLGNNYKPTLKNVLRVYAPPSENDTKKYIGFVSENAKINPNKILSVADANKIIPHMIVMEKGHKTAKIYQQFARK